MAFWWVNHRKTFRTEIDGSFIWAPQTNKAGERGVQKPRRHVLYVKYGMKDQDLFDKAYGYIEQYY